MLTLALYLESGPRQRKTMVHVLDLLGCTAQGATTDEALAATPAAVHTYLAFMARHAAATAALPSPEVEFETAIAAHVMEGDWLGNGDPTPGFGPDFVPLAAADLAAYLVRLAVMRAALRELVAPLSPAQLAAEPQGRGRTIYAILEHSVTAQAGYLRYLVGPMESMSVARRAVSAGPEDVLPALEHAWEIDAGRLAVLSEAERTCPMPHGQVTWTARRCLRRTLEHEWEHLLEIATRLAQPLP